ncbi:MAG: hypothetical protein BWX55_00257 [Deltaproteobacteria bacterium ADurb.Bin022]|jgi:hypothetical protein|nr:MAG: hypothetical protein BWX55_00257 [Deltaproteobacteria bacterium ADurb.Bin022]
MPVCTDMTKKETNRIPAFAGMTDRVMDAGLHRHDKLWIHSGGSLADHGAAVNIRYTSGIICNGKPIG